jgi:hypothetical protein
MVMTIRDPRDVDLEAEVSSCKQIPALVTPLSTLFLHTAAARTFPPVKCRTEWTSAAAWTSDGSDIEGNVPDRCARVTL